MASIPKKKGSSRPPPETVEQRFRRLVAQWESEVGHLSSMTAASKHPAYQEIVGLGLEVVPLLLRDLEENETHWFIALRQITGANPISASMAGNIPQMAKAWLHWAKQNGYQWGQNTGWLSLS